MRGHPIVVPSKDPCHLRRNILVRMSVREKNRGPLRKDLRGRQHLNSKQDDYLVYNQSGGAKEGRREGGKEAP
jgi:hypothetical protein